MKFTKVLKTKMQLYTTGKLGWQVSPLLLPSTDFSWSWSLGRDTYL